MIRCLEFSPATRRSYLFEENLEMSTTEPAIDGVRIRRPNITIDQDGVKYERLRQLKSSRSAAKAVVTRRQNEARETMSTFGDVTDLEQKLSDLNVALNNFQAAHDTRSDTDSLEYYDATQLLANDTKGLSTTGFKTFERRILRILVLLANYRSFALKTGSITPLNDKDHEQVELKHLSAITVNIRISPGKPFRYH